MIVTIQFDTANSDDGIILAAIFGDTPTAPAPTAKAPKAAPKAPDAEVETDLLGAEEGEKTLRERAVQRATELVTTGQSPKVREALAAAGAKRVSDLTVDKLAGFLAAIS